MGSSGAWPLSCSTEMDDVAQRGSLGGDSGSHRRSSNFQVAVFFFGRVFNTFRSLLSSEVLYSCFCWWHCHPIYRLTATSVILCFEYKWLSTPETYSVSSWLIPLDFFSGSEFTLQHWSSLFRSAWRLLEPLLVVKVLWSSIAHMPFWKHLAIQWYVFQKRMTLDQVIVRMPWAWHSGTTTPVTNVGGICCV